MLLMQNNKFNKKTANILKRKNIYTMDDLARFFPRRYIDYRTVRNINDCTDGETAVLRGKLTSVEKRSAKSGRDYLVMKVKQADGTWISVMCFNNLYKYEYYLEIRNRYVVLAGKVSFGDYGWTVSNPSLFVEAEYFKPRIQSVYTKFSGMSEQRLNDLIYEALLCTEEPLEKAVLQKDSVPDYQDSLYKIHRPKTPQEIAEGQRRVLYNDLLYFSISLQKDQPSGDTAGVPFASSEQTEAFIQTLPFRLTRDQKEAISGFAADTKQAKHVDMLLQGDVGCGKTIVAICTMMQAAENGFQSLLLAPRSVLARQHYEEVRRRIEASGKTCVFLHAGLKAKERKEVLKQIADGTADMIIGTHSAINKDVVYKSLALVVTDEEHLFGVRQKEALKEKTVPGYHRISMSATPIPRTIAGAIYGESKQVVQIRTKPDGRKDIITVVPADRRAVFAFLQQQLEAGHQAYVVCPAIEGDEDDTLVSIETVESEYRRHFEPQGFSVAIVNGKMKKEEIAEQMKRFTEGDASILISTTVIEVGVNVPNATVMIIEQADRFGLASLHQLRGRVGRSDLQSYCFLMTEAQANERLLTMTQTNDGFVIAEADLKQRGSGDLIGTRQAGMNRYVEEMLKYPKIYEHIKKTAAFCIQNGYGEALVALYEEHLEAAEA